MMSNQRRFSRQSPPIGRGFILALVLAGGLVAAAIWSLVGERGGMSEIGRAVAAGEPTVQTGPSGLPLPRFVSLKADRVNVRAGPGRDHRVTWTFAREGLPVEVVAEFDTWRRIRDSDGAEGWVFHSLLSGRRTGVVAPWTHDQALPLRRTAADSAATIAYLEPGVLVDLQACDGTWCRVSVQSVAGWMPQELLWGVYPREVIR